MIGGFGRAGLVAALLLFVVVLAPAARAATLSADEFARAYAARVEEIFPESKATVKGPLEVHIRMKEHTGTEALKTYLDNAYKKYLDEPARLDEVMDRYIRILGNDLSQAPVAKREQLVPVIRRRGFMDEARKAKRADQSFPEKQINGDIFMFYAFDAPDTIRFADSSSIEKLGLTDLNRDAVAIANLRRIMSAPLIDTSPEMVVLSSTDPYLTSTLLIDTFWTVETFRFRGDLVVFVIARDLMLVTGSEEPGGLATARKTAQNLIGQLPYAISVEPIVRRQGKWQSFIQ